MPAKQPTQLSSVICKLGRWIIHEAFAFGEVRPCRARRIRFLSVIIAAAVLLDFFLLQVLVGFNFQAMFTRVAAGGLLASILLSTGGVPAGALAETRTRWLAVHSQGVDDNLGLMRGWDEWGEGSGRGARAHEIGGAGGGGGAPAEWCAPTLAERTC
eukprot:1195008-Prorocentrum_minimum.AAC.1